MLNSIFHVSNVMCQICLNNKYPHPNHGQIPFKAKFNQKTSHELNPEDDFKQVLQPWYNHDNLHREGQM